MIVSKAELIFVVCKMYNCVMNDIHHHASSSEQCFIEKKGCVIFLTTVNSLMFARDLFREFRERCKIANINIRKHNSCVPSY